MAKTAQFITAPAPGTVINPVHTYTEEQTAQIAALREVRPALRIQTRRAYLYRARPLTVRALDRAPRVRPVPPLRTPLARQARHPPALHARRQVEARRRHEAHQGHPRVAPRVQARSHSPRRGACFPAVRASTSGVLMRLTTTQVKIEAETGKMCVLTYTRGANLAGFNLSLRL